MTSQDSRQKRDQGAPIFHALLGRQLPKVSDLLERCEPEGARVLELACRFADARRDLQEKIRNLQDQAFRHPWMGPYSERPQGPESLVEADLIRALLATRPDELRRQILADREPSPAWSEDVRHWTTARGRISANRRTNEIQRPWVWRWALQLLNARELSIDVARLIGSVGDYPSYRWDLEQSEGMVTQSDVYNRVIRDLGEERAPDLPHILPAYYDWQGVLPMLDDTLTSHRAAVLVGDSGCGKKVAAHAWSTRAALEGQPAYLRGCGFEWGSASGSILSPDAEDPPSPFVFAFTHNVPTGSWDLARGSFGERAVAALERVLQLLAAPGGKTRLLIVATPDEREALSRRFGEISSFPGLRVEQPSDEHILPVWLCHVFDLEADWAEGEISLAHALAGFETLRNPREFTQAGMRLLNGAQENREKIGEWASTLGAIRAKRYHRVRRRTRDLIETWAGSLESFDELIGTIDPMFLGTVRNDSA